MSHDTLLIERLNAMGLQLPAAPKPQALYAPWSMHPLDANGSSSLVVLSGQTCRRNGVPMVGTCRTESDVAPAREAAQIAALNALALLHAACEGRLERVKRLLRLRGFVASSADFALHSQVLDGSSELLKVAFPDLPLPARTAVGVSSLPSGCWVEVELEAVIH
ncbi:RidA family protein (plasmid) [Diaphorobacter sp. HDW4B]|uniref:RidA family protein n=1 Tax=Diaphorobacter sp. HDW4B TaxID=2714925 RepID=UPI00140E0B93|nr:RidA family protein [Diaphorobacter sp. HDW4B]QIL74272.1 RidA family protein [Diaphorobacter sp. HDW4B]